MPCVSFNPGASDSQRCVASSKIANILNFPFSTSHAGSAVLGARTYNMVYGL